MEDLELVAFSLDLCLGLIHFSGDLDPDRDRWDLDLRDSRDPERDLDRTVELNSLEPDLLLLLLFWWLSCLCSFLSFFSLPFSYFSLAFLHCSLRLSPTVLAFSTFCPESFSRWPCASVLEDSDRCVFVRLLFGDIGLVWVFDGPGWAWTGLASDFEDIGEVSCTPEDDTSPIWVGLEISVRTII